MQSFAVITDTPQRLASFLEQRGIIEQVTDTVTGKTSYVGVNPGMEWVRVPNPIITDPGSGTLGQPGFVPPTHDTRSVFLVKFARESETEKAQGFRDWLLANTSVQTAPAGWTIGGEPVGDARKVTGQNVWLVNDRPERFGIWQ
jgi:hypothetical protein